MRYELDKNNYISKVFFGCTSGNCLEYTGAVPDGYETLEEWATTANIQAYKIVDGNLTYDATKNTELEALWNNQGKRILWQGASYMNATQTATLSESVSSQLNGIVLVWSKYDGGAKDTNWHYFFVPKQHTELASGGGVNCVLGTAGFQQVGCKYVYVRDTEILGFTSNNATGTTNGITWANNAFVLRYVLGV